MTTQKCWQMFWTQVALLKWRLTNYGEILKTWALYETFIFEFIRKELMELIKEYLSPMSFYWSTHVLPETIQNPLYLCPTIGKCNTKP